MSIATPSTQSLSPQFLSATRQFAESLERLALAEPRAVMDAAAADSLPLEHSEELARLEAAVAQFTRAGLALPAEQVAEARSVAQAALHPFVLQAPFVRRAYEKPLGYPGDYGMVRYILENPFQGDSAYAQLLNWFFLRYDVAQGHRNRISILERKLHQLADRAQADGMVYRVLTIGCGPAEETYRVLRDHPSAHLLDVTLLDFNRETLDWALTRIESLQAGRPLKAAVAGVEESVFTLAKKRPSELTPEYDFVVCAGLFDYLSDRLCSRVMEYGLNVLNPGGLLLVTNVSQVLSAEFMSLVMEWELIYRTKDELAALLPKGSNIAHRVELDSTGTNVVAELRKA